MFLLSHAARVDLDDNTYIEDTSVHSMCCQLAGAAARTGQPLCSFAEEVPSNTVSLLAYWGSHIESEIGGGCACAIVLATMSGEVFLHSWVAKPVNSYDSHECEMLSLLGALELLLSGVGVNALGSTDSGSRLRSDCM
jgi:hypothetical protein